MIDLVRDALLGDKEAQERCTELGIVLPCPACESEAKMNISYPRSHNELEFSVRCQNSHCLLSFAGVPRKSKEEALMGWNTRPAPPITKEDHHEKS